jgi:hypothetical protein
MMTSVTFGPPFVIDGPLPVAPARSLLTAPGVLQDSGDDRWMNGAAVYGYPDGTPLLWDPCASGTYETKSDESSFETPDFAAFVAYLPITCSAISLASDPEGFAERAEKALDATISYAIEYALASGIPTLANPFLGDANVDVLALGAAVTPMAGLSYLEDAIGDTARAGMIHATPATVSSWFATYPMPDPATTLYTTSGNIVVPGGGYKGAVPYGESQPADGQAWAFATGPVKVWVSREPTFNIEDVLDRAVNDVTFRAERYALVEWDTSLQAAVLIDWASCGCV